jgi:hypothetical protein
MCTRLTAHLGQDRCNPRTSSTRCRLHRCKSSRPPSRRCHSRSLQRTRRSQLGTCQPSRSRRPRRKYTETQCALQRTARSARIGCPRCTSGTSPRRTPRPDRTDRSTCSSSTRCCIPHRQHWAGMHPRCSSSPGRTDGWMSIRPDRRRGWRIPSPRRTTCWRCRLLRRDRRDR